MEVKTIYRVENAQELFDGLSKCRGAGDTGLVEGKAGGDARPTGACPTEETGVKA